MSYRLDFTFTEFDGNKKVNSRTYSVTCEDTGGRWAGSLRVGSRVPVAVGQFSSSSAQNLPVSTQFQYQDVGVNIDVVIEQNNDALTLGTTAEVSSLADAPGGMNLSMPVIRQMKFRSNTALTSGKPIVLSTADDVASNRRFEVTVVATKLGK